RRRLPHAVKGGAHRLRKEPRSTTEPDVAVRNHRAGAMRFDSEDWRLPEALAEASETGSTNVMRGRVMLVVSILAIIFIAIMAWFVSQMPAK
ncbi:MAG TPA: hypothetical protein VI479_10315, partial [Blastocatellia bacterium]